MIETRMTFNGHELSPYLLVTDVRRCVMPSRRLSTVQVPGMDGAHLQSCELDAIEITVSGVLLRHSMDDVAQCRRELAAILNTGGPAPLVLPDEPGLYTMAVYEGGAEPSRLISVPEIELVFYCPDPVAYGSKHTVEIDGSMTLVSGGSHIAYPVITCKPPAGDSWTVTDIGTGRFVRVSANFNGSQTVVLDMGLERCTVNGADHPVDLESDFFGIDGASEVSLSGGTAVATWRERWL